MIRSDRLTKSPSISFHVSVVRNFSGRWSLVQWHEFFGGRLRQSMTIHGEVFVWCYYVLWQTNDQYVPCKERPFTSFHFLGWHCCFFKASSVKNLVEKMRIRFSSVWAESLAVEQRWWLGPDHWITELLNPMGEIHWSLLETAQQERDLLGDLASKFDFWSAWRKCKQQRV